MLESLWDTESDDVFDEVSTLQYRRYGCGKYLVHVGVKVVQLGALQYSNGKCGVEYQF